MTPQVPTTPVVSAQTSPFDLLKHPIFTEPFKPIFPTTQPISWVGPKTTVTVERLDPEQPITPIIDIKPIITPTIFEPFQFKPWVFRPFTMWPSPAQP